VAEVFFLNCPTCGSPLEVVKNQPQFTCQHCQAYHLIKRSGKVVYLCSLEQELESVQQRANRAASERIINTLNQEIKALEADLRDLRSEGAPLDNVRMIGMAVITLGLFLAIIYGITNTMMMGYMAAGIVLGIALHSSTGFIGKDYYIRKRYLEELIDQKRGEILNNEKKLNHFELERAG
jgi:DNA-directed RNA polymerase subunit RPC12/RpoP